MNEIDKRRRKRHKELELVFVNHFKREMWERENGKSFTFGRTSSGHMRVFFFFFFYSKVGWNQKSNTHTHIKNHVSGFLIFISLATSHATYTIVLLICAHCLLCTVWLMLFFGAWKQASLHPLRWETVRDDGKNLKLHSHSN